MMAVDRACVRRYSGRTLRLCFVAASHQNAFFGELLEALAIEASAAGVVVERLADCFPEPAEDLVTVFVPHEYLPLTQIEAHPSPRQLARSIAICTEQPGTDWFEQAAGVAQHAGAALDINPLGVAELARRGIAARRLQLGYVPTWDCWGGDESVERPIDLTFMGGYTERRGIALARCGPCLHDRELSLHLVENTLPHQADDPNFLSDKRKWELLRDSKLALNIHRSELAYMEWHRVLDAMINGCVVVAEHSLGVGPLEPDRHFVSARYDDLHLAVAATLDDPGRLRAIRQEAYRFLRDEMPMAAAIGTLVETAEAVCAEPLDTRVGGESSPVPRPNPPAWPTPGYLKRAVDDGDVMRMALKHVMLEVQGLRREIGALRGEGDEADDNTTETFGRHGEVTPRVSVVVSLFNYEDHVGEALTSVARSSFRDLEVIVVDDASRDGSADAARAALSAYAWMPSTLVRRGRNRGLAAARNLGLQRARGEYAFILDADNAVYPRGLERLVDALDAHPNAAFAYGILEKFNDRGAVGLESWLGWNPIRLRYGNFVDAMAMLRREPVLAVGGYSSEPAMYGWEDFALWCALADKGQYGVRVPSILARYRVGLTSMISLASVDDRATWSALLRRYAFLQGEPVSVPAAT